MTFNLFFWRQSKDPAPSHQEIEKEQEELRRRLAKEVLRRRTSEARFRATNRGDQ
jgi:hypothetical protein